MTAHSPIAISETTEWKDIVLEIANDKICVRTGRSKRELTFTDAGFGERDQRLATLRLFAAARGHIPTNKPEAFEGKTPLKKRVSVLRQHLCNLFQIEGDPISSNRLLREYVCNFQIHRVGENSFPTPTGASWLHFRFTECANGNLSVSVYEREVRCATSIDQVSLERVVEAGEFEVRIVRNYKLDEIGLNARGSRARERAVFIELLRNGGRLRRKPGDMDLLKLAEWLRDWTGLADPLIYVERTREWAANFDCATEKPGQRDFSPPSLI